MNDQILSAALSEPEEWSYRWPLHDGDAEWSDRQLGVVYASAYRHALVYAGREAIGPAEWSREYVPGVGLCLVATTQTCRILADPAHRRAAA
jgi:hypothetical protein